MKKIVFLIAFSALVFNDTFAQTNAFPSSGNAGVGTATPENLEGWDKVLELRGTDHAQFLVSTTNNYVQTGIWSHKIGYFYSYNPGGFAGTKTSHPFSLITNYTSRLTVSPDGDVGIGFAYQPTQLFDVSGKFVVNGTTGNTGIGTTNPLSKFVVSNASWQENSNIKLPVATLESTSHGGAGIRFLQTATMEYGIGIDSFSASGNLRIVNTNGSTADITNSTKGIIINKFGRVGIGTTNTSDTSFKLFVESGIRTRKVKVDQTSWADYVFAPSYKLRPLSEVESFIKKYRHLPDVPSATEVKKEGLDLGDNQAVLLKKIEELTLYLLEADKKNKELEKRMKVLEQK